MGNPRWSGDYLERFGPEPEAIAPVTMPLDVNDGELFPEIAQASAWARRQREAFPLRHHFASNQLEQIRRDK